MGGFQGGIHNAGQIAADRVQVHRVLQPGRELGYGLVRVVAGPVEPPVNRVLDPAPDGREQRGRGQRGDGHRDRAVELAGPAA